MFMPDVYFSQYEKQNGSKKEKNFLEDIYEFIQKVFPNIKNYVKLKT